MMAKALAWMNAHPLAWASVACAVTAISAYEAGRWSKPTEVRETVKYVEKIVYQDREVVKTVEVVKWRKQVAKDVHRETTTTKTPDGGSVTTTVIDSRDRTTVGADSATQVDKTKDTLVTKDSELRTEKVTINQRDWLHFTVQAGTNVTGIPKLTWGGTAEIRLIGPVWVGAWGNSALFFGGSVGLGF